MAAWLGLDLETSAHVVLVNGEVRRWRDVINFDEYQPAWPLLVPVWLAAGVNMKEFTASGFIENDDVDSMFVSSPEEKAVVADDHQS